MGGKGNHKQKMPFKEHIHVVKCIVTHKYKINKTVIHVEAMVSRILLISVEKRIGTKLPMHCIIKYM